MKQLLLIFFIATTLFGQLLIPNRNSRSWAVNLDGTTEYMSKSSPTKLDLNGDERITTATNRTFETTVGDWVAVGSASIDTSSAQKQAGAKSLKIITSGSWSGAQLPYSAFTALQQDANGIYEKYTLEFWVYNESADTVQAIIGDKSIKRNIPATTWTKFVYNFQTTANTINQSIQILFKTTGKTNYVDNVSLAKVYDAVFFIWCFSNSLTQQTVMTNQNDVNPNNPGYSFTNYASSPNLFWRFVLISTGGSSQYAFVYYLAPPNEIITLVAVTINRTGNMILYKDMVSMRTTSVSEVGNTNNTNAIRFGAEFDNGRKLSGQLGEVQITRFTDISQSNVNTTTLTQAYKLGIPKSWIGGGAEVVAHYKFRGASDGDMLQDISGNGNDLTGTNVSTTDQVKASYPSR